MIGWPGDPAFFERQSELRRRMAGDTSIQPEGGPTTVKTIYDVLRKLISGEPWQEEERRAAYALISELEAVNLLGNVAQTMTAHDERGS